MKKIKQNQTRIQIYKQKTISLKKKHSCRKNAYMLMILNLLFFRLRGNAIVWCHTWVGRGRLLLS